MLGHVHEYSTKAELATIDATGRKRKKQNIRHMATTVQTGGTPKCCSQDAISFTHSQDFILTAYPL